MRDGLLEAICVPIGEAIGAAVVDEGVGHKGSRDPSTVSTHHSEIRVADWAELAVSQAQFLVVKDPLYS